MIVLKLLVLLIGFVIWAPLGLLIWLVVLPRVLLLFAIALPVKLYRGANIRRLIDDLMDTIAIYPRGFSFLYNVVMHDYDDRSLELGEEKSTFRFLFEIVQSLLLISVIYWLFFSNVGFVEGVKLTVDAILKVYQQAAAQARILLGR